MTYMIPEPISEQDFFRYLRHNKPINKQRLVERLKQTEEYRMWMFHEDMRYQRELEVFEFKLSSGRLVD